jgi:hypothetical protein
MAGGIFTNKPFVLNLKCVIISIIGIILFLIPGYGISGGINSTGFWVVLIMLFMILYVAIAFYDYLYDCDERMKKGKYSITASMKPPNTYKTKNKNCCEELQIANEIGKSANLLHLVAVAPFLFYVGYVGIQYAPVETAWMYNMLKSTAIITGLFHGWKFNYRNK